MESTTLYDETMPMAEGQITEVINRVQGLHDLAGRARSIVTKTADRMFGEEPGVAGGEGPANQPSGDIDQLRTCLDHLEQRLKATTYQIERLSVL